MKMKRAEAIDRLEDANFAGPGGFCPTPETLRTAHKNLKLVEEVVGKINKRMEVIRETFSSNDGNVKLSVLYELRMIRDLLTEEE